MRISLFYEFPLPRPWAPDDEHKLFQDGLDEVELADKAGFSTVWLTEDSVPWSGGLRIWRVSRVLINESFWTLGDLVLFGKCCNGVFRVDHRP
jgi:hypothetical protein